MQLLSNDILGNGKALCVGVGGVVVQEDFYGHCDIQKLFLFT